jgi:biotin carboxyl carrier protein
MTKKLRITVEGKAYDVTVDSLEGSAPAPVAAAPAPVAAAVVAAAPAPKAPKAAAPVAAGSGVVTSPLAGKVDSIDVKVGQQVAEGQNIVTLEAMKMKTYVTSHVAGTVSAIHVNPGDSVEEGRPLVTIG